MNKKQKLTAFALSLSLMSASAAAFAQAPQSQFGFKGWPYRQNSYCETPAVTPQPSASEAPAPTLQPTAVPTQAPTQAPTATPAPTPAPPVSTPPSNGDDYTTPSISAQEENAFYLLNQDRIANGLAPLALDPELSALARRKSRDMYENNYFAHTSPTYGSASDMLKQFGYSFNAVGENIAHHATVEKSQAAFMSSSGHRRNILSTSWTKVGIGVWYDAQGFVYVTQLFVR